MGTTFSSNCWATLTEFFLANNRGLGDPSRLGWEVDSIVGEFLDEPLSLADRWISSRHSRRNEASSSSSLPSS